MSYPTRSKQLRKNDRSFLTSRNISQFLKYNFNDVVARIVHYRLFLADFCSGSQPRNSGTTFDRPRCRKSSPAKPQTSPGTFRVRSRDHGRGRVLHPAEVPLAGIGQSSEPVRDDFRVSRPDCFGLKTRSSFSVQEDRGLWTLGRIPVDKGRRPPR